MIKKIAKFCVTAIIAFLIALIAWYFLLIDLPKHQVIGTAAPTMSKEKALDLMNYHGVKVVWAEGGEWFFRRNGKDCRLKRMEK